MKSRPDLFMRLGLVVTPSTRLSAFNSRISSISAVSTKNFMRVASGCRASALVVRGDSSPRYCAMEHPKLLESPPSMRVFAPGEAVAVVTADGLDRLLDYRAPDGGARPGDLVEVPLGPRRVLGLVWGEGQGGFDVAKLRDVTRILDAPPLQPAMRGFLARAAEYTLTPLPVMLRLATRAPGLGAPPAARPLLRRSGTEPDRLTDARARVLAAFAEYGNLGFAPSELSQLAGVSSGVVKGLEAQGVLLREDAPRDAPYPRLDPGTAPRPLSPAQGECRRHAARRGPRPELFDHAAEGRHRVGQDRGLPRGRRRGARPRPSGPGPAARDRALRRVPRPGRGPLRRPARRVAFRRDPGRPPPGLDRRRHRRRPARGRRPLGAVPAVRRARPDRRRRGARRLLQAGGRRLLPRPRHGRAARLARGRRRGPRLRHAVARELGQRRGRQVRPPRPARALRRRRTAGDAGDRPARAPAGTGALDLRAAGVGGRRTPRRRRAGAAVSQPPRLRAADHLPRLRPSGRLRPLRRAHGRASLPQAPRLPPVRRDQADP